jgi:uncharacterized membrane protein
MVRVDHELTVNRPAAEVFAYLTNVETLPEWQASVVAARRVTDGPLAPGARFVEARSLLGHKVESTIEVTEFDPDRRFSLRVVSGPVPFRVTHTLDEIGGATRLRVEGEGEPHGAARLAGPFVARRARQEFERDFSRLKTLLESRPMAAAIPAS